MLSKEKFRACRISDAVEYDDSDNDDWRPYTITENI